MPLPIRTFERGTRRLIGRRVPDPKRGVWIVYDADGAVVAEEPGYFEPQTAPMPPAEVDAPGLAVPRLTAPDLTYVVPKP